MISSLKQWKSERSKHALGNPWTLVRSHHVNFQETASCYLGDITITHYSSALLSVSSSHSTHTLRADECGFSFVSKRTGKKKSKKLLTDTRRRISFCFCQRLQPPQRETKTEREKEGRDIRAELVSSAFPQRHRLSLSHRWWEVGIPADVAVCSRVLSPCAVPLRRCCVQGRPL